jgi:hypothetical protein
MSNGRLYTFVIHPDPRNPVSDNADVWENAVANAVAESFPEKTVKLDPFDGGFSITIFLSGDDEARRLAQRIEEKSEPYGVDGEVSFFRADQLATEPKAVTGPTLPLWIDPGDASPEVNVVQAILHWRRHARRLRFADRSDLHCVRYCVCSSRQGPIFGGGNAGRVRELPRKRRHFVGPPDP